MKKKYVVTLTAEERRSLRALVSSGKGAAPKLTRAESVGRNRGRYGSRTAFSAGFRHFWGFPSTCRSEHQFAARVPAASIPPSMSFQPGFPRFFAPRLGTPELCLGKSTHRLC